MKTNIKISVKGMTCANCAAGIKKHLEKQGLSNVHVNFITEEVSYDIGNNQSIEVEGIIKNLGYRIVSKEENKEEKPSKKIEKYFYFTLVFTLPLFCHMFVGEESILHNPLIQCLLCLPVYIIGLLHFGKSAWISLKSGVPNMDVLILIGSSAAFIYSMYGWVFFISDVHNYLFFETTATIITLVLLGNVLEHKSVQKTTTAIRDLAAIQKVTAKRKKNSKLEEIPFENIELNDILIVNTGDKIPTDGIIISGDCLIDESMVTGESMPVSKKSGSEVIGGTIITDGNIAIKALKIGNDTLLSQIIKLVRDSQKNKPNIQKLGDQVSAVFVPAVISISLITFLLGHFYFAISIQDSLLRAIAVLVISCPCAMGLATPTAVMVGIGRAAKNGVLIKGGDTLEKLATIKNIIFDKTGTLTTGKFKIEELNIIQEATEEDEIRNIIYNIEIHSSHPIAKSLCNEFKESYSPLNLTNIIEEKGKSISAIIKEDTYKITSSESNTKNNDYDLQVLKNNEPIATINISDKLKADTKEVLDEINKKEYTTFLLSGDKRSKCEKIATSLNIQHVYSEQLPAEKISRVAEIDNISPAAMIGDGINDAPALAKASVGISLGDATQIAIQTADVILLNNNNLKQLPKALLLGKHTLLTIKQNLFWAFAYNLVAIPIAISGLLNPMWGALFMAFSDVIVIGNSIRLRYKKI